MGLLRGERGRKIGFASSPPVLLSLLMERAAPATASVEPTRPMYDIRAGVRALEIKLVRAADPAMLPHSLEVASCRGKTVPKRSASPNIWRGLSPSCSSR